MSSPVSSTALPSLEHCAAAMTVDDLKWYAAALPVKAPTRKAELVQVLVQSLTNPQVVQQLWPGLTPLQRLVVAEVVHHQGGRYDAEVLAAKYPGATPPANPRAYDGYRVIGFGAGRTPATPYDVLFCYDYELGRYIPSDMQKLLRTIAPAPAPATLAASPEIPPITAGKKWRGPAETQVAQTEIPAFHDLAATLYAVQQGKISVSASTRLPSLASLRTLRPHLLIDDYFADAAYERNEDAMRPLALIVLVQAAKWAAPSGTGGKLELTKSGLALPTGALGPEHIRDAWTRWLKSDLLDELSRVRAIRGQQSRAARLTKPAERRETLARVLRECPVGQWVMLDDLFRYMRAERLSPQIERTRESELYIGPYPEYGALGYSSHYWEVVIGSYLRAVLWEYAATLGLIDIGYTAPEDGPHDFSRVYGMDDLPYLSRYDGLRAIRLTNLGAYVLGLTATYTPGSGPTKAADTPLIQVLPNLDIVVTNTERLLLSDRAILERIGTRESDNVYRLDREQVLEATQHGLSVTQMQEFLAEKSAMGIGDLPQTVQVFFDDIAQRLTAVRESGRMVVLEGDDPYLLTELAHTSGLRSMVQLATISGRTVLLVPEEREVAVRRQLRKLGYIPLKR